MVEAPWRASTLACSPTTGRAGGAGSLEAFNKALGLFRRLGAEIHELSLADLRRRARAQGRVRACRGRSRGGAGCALPQRARPLLARNAWLSRLGPEGVALRLVDADRTMEIAAHELGRCFAAVDAIVTPTTPQAAFPFGGKAPDTQGDFCALANMAGCPAISLPMEWTGMACRSGCKSWHPRRKTGVFSRSLPPMRPLPIGGSARHTAHP